jgi:AraC family transcriptional activator of pyochelin receptor
MMQAAQRIDVSPEFTVVVGRGPFESGNLPPDAIGLLFAWGGAGAAAVLRIVPPHEWSDALEGEAELPGALLLFLSRTALLRIGGEPPNEADQRGYHLPSELRTIAIAALHSGLEGEMLMVYRGGKALELLCETVRLRREGALVPMPSGGALSLADSRRVMDARRLIDERSREKLTLEGIARECGLNRAKLTRGFREMFDCTIAEALAERRLASASHMLLTTDLPVSSVGYQAGYLNNASFARAFSRRFGACPSDYRAQRLAA